MIPTRAPILSTRAAIAPPPPTGLTMLYVFDSSRSAAVEANDLELQAHFATLGFTITEVEDGAGDAAVYDTGYDVTWVGDISSTNFNDWPGRGLNVVLVEVFSTDDVGMILEVNRVQDNGNEGYYDAADAGHPILAPFTPGTDITYGTGAVQRLSTDTPLGSKILSQNSEPAGRGRALVMAMDVGEGYQVAGPGLADGRWVYFGCRRQAAPYTADGLTLAGRCALWAAGSI